MCSFWKTHTNSRSLYIFIFLLEAILRMWQPSRHKFRILCSKQPHETALLRAKGLKQLRLSINNLIKIKKWIVCTYHTKLFSSIWVNQGSVTLEKITWISTPVCKCKSFITGWHKIIHFRNLILIWNKNIF